MNKIVSWMCLISMMFGVSCTVDNYDEPDCQVHGRIVYNGQPLGLKGTGATVRIELWQSGFGKEMPQDIMVGQDGSFSTYVYGGRCRLVAKNGIGPWESRHDTVYVDVNGSVQVDYEVIPYFMISEVDYTLTPDSILTANFDVIQVSQEAQIASIGIIVNKTRFVDLMSNIQSVSLPGYVGSVNLTIDLKDAMKKEKFLFTRVFVKNAGVDEALYSADVHQLK